MSITVSEIRNKEFSKSGRGYNLDEVDDFLDALADQTEKLVRDNVALRNEVKEANDALAAAQEEAAQAQENAGPAFNEANYIKNLETTLRETLISAQRIADETVAEARKEAERIVSEAQEQAKAMTAEAEAKSAEANANFEAIKNASEEYRSAFNNLLEGQAKLLKDSSMFA